jgi:hypothetical protein
LWGKILKRGKREKGNCGRKRKKEETKRENRSYKVKYRQKGPN